MENLLITANIQAILVSFPCACLAWFFIFCQKRGNIFEWYGNLLVKLPVFLAKPLGECVYCFATWLNFFVCVHFDLVWISVLFSSGYTYFFCMILALLENE
jgi:hypothetical protein